MKINQLLQSVTSPFDQRDLISKFLTLDSEGACRGLCMDYARHVISNKNSGKNSDYISKLNRKLMVFDKDTNFSKRIKMYQAGLQNYTVGGDINLENDSSIINNEFTNSIPKEHYTSSVIGLGFSRNNNSGHIIAAQVIRNDTSEIIGYKIFDPNIGEFDFSKSENIDENIKHFNEVIKNIYQMYKEEYGMEKCYTIDLEKLVTKYQLVKQKDQSQYISENKYLDKNPSTQDINFFVAIKKGNKETVELLLTKGVDINQTFYSGYTHFFLAIQEGNKEITKLLLTKGVDINQTFYSGHTPLSLAVQAGNKGIVKLLLAEGANVNQADKDKITPLSIAVQAGNKEITELLLTKGANVDQPFCGGFTPLYIAVQAGNKEITELLLTKDANVNQIFYNGHTPLSIAVQAGNKEITELLLTKGANVDQPFCGGFTPLYIAVQAGNKEITELLLTKDANVNQIFYSGHTPLSLAVQAGNKEIIELLLTKDANIDQIDKNGFTPLYIATKKGNKKIINMLKVKLGTNITETLNFSNISLSLNKEIIDPTADFQTEIVNKIKIDIENLAKQGKSLTIKNLILAFPEEKRVEYFAESATKAIIECVTQEKDKKVEIILEAFPNYQDRENILNNALLTFNAPSLILIKQKAKELWKNNTNIPSSPTNISETPKILKHERIR